MTNPPPPDRHAKLEQRELQEILDAIASGSIEDADQLSDEDWTLLRLHFREQDQERLFDQLKGGEPALG